MNIEITKAMLIGYCNDNKVNARILIDAMFDRFHGEPLEELVEDIVRRAEAHAQEVVEARK